MGAKKLPRELTLPSGQVVRLRELDAAPRLRGAQTPPVPEAWEGGRLMRGAHEGGPRPPRDGSGGGSGGGGELFAGSLALLECGRVEVTTREGGRVDVDALPLGDFHLLRAVATRAGLLEEEEVAVSCRNCSEEIRVKPCAGLEIGPWEHGELGDEELDTTLPFGEPIEIPTIPLGRVRTASTVTFEPRTVGEARPLFRALARPRFDVTAEVVRAMGITALGKERDADRIAEALAACDEPAFGAVTDAFLASHYVLRLGCVAICPSCGARNDVDAPYDREIEPSGERPRPPAGDHDHDHDRDDGEAPSTFPDFDAFAARAKVLAGPMLAEIPGAPVELLVDEGTPAVDDGGEPLLGSYVPPYEGSMAAPTRPPTVTLYYRTFRAMWDEDGPYDWDAELSETIEHELEHHVFFLRGDDPMDDEERAVIRDEALRIVGKREAGRRAVEGFGASLVDFVKRTWPLWVIALLALAAMLATQRE